MKINFRILLTFLCFSALLLTGCSDENEEARTPVASFSLDKDKLETGESMTISFKGVADKITVFTGDEGHKYMQNDGGKNEGINMDKGVLTYSYSTPGTYHVVCLAVTSDTYLAQNERVDSVAFDINVTDDNVDIKAIYSRITPNIYEAKQVDDGIWLLNIPVKHMYNGREISINAKRQRLAFTTSSSLTKIFVDDTQYDPNSTSQRFDLTITHKIKSVSYAGEEKTFSLFTVIYPEFQSFKIGDAVASQTRNAFYQDLLTYTLSLPEGTDPKNVVPEFVTDSEGDVKFYADGKEVKPGTAIDLTLPDGTYTLVRTSKENAKATATTRVRFVIE